MAIYHGQYRKEFIISCKNVCVNWFEPAEQDILQRFDRTVFAHCSTEGLLARPRKTRIYPWAPCPTGVLSSRLRRLQGEAAVSILTFSSTAAIAPFRYRDVHRDSPFLVIGAAWISAVPVMHPYVLQKVSWPWTDENGQLHRALRSRQVAPPKPSRVRSCYRS